MREWLQISSGRGPAECGWVVPRVLRCMIQEAEQQGLSVDVLESVAGTFPNTLKSALLSIDGPETAGFVKSWSGTAQWIGRSPFRPEYKRKNWFVGIEPLAVPNQPQWCATDLRFETMRASGPGGQHTNKTESAVRVTHAPTGLSAIAREERSQSQNKKLALARLAELFDARRKSGEEQIKQTRWSQHDALERGNATRTFIGPKFELQA